MSPRPDDPEVSFMGQQQAGPARPVGVSELNRQARALLERTFPDVWVEGEISRPTRAGSGHLYFTLKDREARVDAVLWARQAQQIRFEPAEGQQVVVRGRLTVYPPQGRYQIVCETMQLSGEGALRAEMLRLKRTTLIEKLKRFDDPQRPPANA